MLEKISKCGLQCKTKRLEKSKNSLYYLKSSLDQISSLQSCMCASHGNDLGFLHKEIPGAIQATAQQLKSLELLQKASNSTESLELAR